MRMMITNWSQRLISQIVTAAKTRRGLSRGRGWGSSGGRKAGGRNDGGRGAELSLFSPPKEIAKKSERDIASKRERGLRSDAKSSCSLHFEPSLPSCKALRATWHSPSVTSLSLSLCPFRLLFLAGIRREGKSVVCRANDLHNAAATAAAAANAATPGRSGSRCSRSNRSRAVMTRRHDI